MSERFQKEQPKREFRQERDQINPHLDQQFKTEYSTKQKY